MIVFARNTAEIRLPITCSIAHHALDITRAAFTRYENDPYVQAPA